MIIHRGFVSSSNFARFQSFPSQQFRSMAVSTEPLESLGDSISTAVLLSWNKQPGESVKEDDVIAVVETDKVTMEIRAKKSGVFVKGLAAQGAEVTIGNDLYQIDTSASGSSPTPTPVSSTPASTPAPAPSSAPTTPPTPSASIEVPVPIMGESITQGILSRWAVKEGTFVKADEVVASIETDKVTVEVRAPTDGVVTKVLATEGAEVTVGNPLFVFSSGGSAPSSPKTASAPAPTSSPKTESKSEAAPKKETPAPATKKESPAPSSSSAPSPKKSLGDRSETRVKMTRMRTRIAQRLKESQNTAAMLTTFQEVDMTNLIELRNKYKDDFEKVNGVKLGFMSAFVSAAAKSLQEVPAINAVIDDKTQEVVYRNYCDISVAVASPTGLVVPVLRNCETMDFAAVEKSIAHYSKKAKEGSLALEDMAGGTFTISNGGVFGSLFGTPIINPPQSAILGMHATKMRAMVVNGQVVPRPMMYLALTYDHRLIDGREAVTFLKSIANKIEDPSRLLLNL